MPQTGAKYEASVSALEDLKLSKNIKNNIYGGYPIDVGLTWGHTNKFVAFEYHQCSELNIALDDVVMVFSKRQILERNHQIDFDKDVQMYYVPKNTAVELYNDTLHYSPLEITKDGYRVIVVVTHDTNKSFASDFKTDNPRLIAQAKFVVAHSDATDEIKLGAPVKIIGHPIELTSIS